MARPATTLAVSECDIRELERLTKAHTTPQQTVTRCQIILLSTQGMKGEDIAATTGISRAMVLRWQSRYKALGLVGLLGIQPGRGRKPKYTQEQIHEVVTKTSTTKPAGMTHWSTRSMARATGISHATIGRIWNEHGLKPHQIQTFKISNDKRFSEKLTDVVGLYLNPPEKAIVLCVDEKSQIQALDRTQPGLPMKKGRCGTMTHDYKRNGTSSLFAALEVMTGKVTGMCLNQHRHQEFIRFMNSIVRQYDADLDLHIIMDNYATHKHAKVVEWLKRHPRVHFHFTPTSSSWLNLVERWFREITDKAIRRGVFHSVPDLVKAIHEFMDAWNGDPMPFKWTATAETIIEKVNRARNALPSVLPMRKKRKNAVK
jgi:transposase